MAFRNLFVFFPLKLDSLSSHKNKNNDGFLLTSKMVLVDVFLKNSSPKKNNPSTGGVADAFVFVQ